MARVPYNKLLTNLASWNRTGEYWPSVTTSGQYSLVGPSRSVSKRLVIYIAGKSFSDVMWPWFCKLGKTVALPIWRLDLIINSPCHRSCERETGLWPSTTGENQHIYPKCIKFDKGGNSLPKHIECNPNIRSNLWISLLSRNQTNTKRARKIFLQLGRICFRILSRQSENFSVFCKVFSQIAFRDVMVPFYRYQWRQPARAHAPFLLSRVLFDTTNLHKILFQLSILIAESR